MADALENVGGKAVVHCNSAWHAENWLFFGVEEFPSIEAVQEHNRCLMELDWFR